MFTGIVKELGVVQRFDRAGSAYSLEIASKDICGKAAVGDSVAVNGVCLTVVERKRDALSFDVMKETISRSTLETLKRGDRVNLEDSLKADGSLGGHFVLGHVDCVGKIRQISRKKTGEFSIEVEMPEGFSRLVVEKGSVALDGVSLTVGETAADSFTVHLIPHTLKTTTLGFKAAGGGLNVEFDIIGKYIAGRKSSILTEEFLRRNGF